MGRRLALALLGYVLGMACMLLLGRYPLGLHGATPILAGLVVGLVPGLVGFYAARDGVGG